MTRNAYILPQRTRDGKSGKLVNLDATEVIVAGEPFNEQWNIYGKGTDRHKLGEKHVYWLCTHAGEWIACLKHPVTKKLKRISIILCQAIWPNVPMTACSARVIARPGLLRPLLPANFVRFKQRTKEKKCAEASKQKHLYNEVIRQYLHPTSHVAIIPGFFTSNLATTTSPKATTNRPEHLKELLAELRTRAHLCPELYKSTIHDSALSSIRTLDDLRAFPYARFLVQFYDFFFGTSANETVVPTKPLQTVAMSDGNR